MAHTLSHVPFLAASLWRTAACIVEPPADDRARLQESWVRESAALVKCVNALLYVGRIFINV